MDKLLDTALTVGVRAPEYALRLVEAAMTRKATSEQERGYAYALACVLQGKPAPTFTEVVHEARRLQAHHGDPVREPFDWVLDWQTTWHPPKVQPPGPSAQR